jgi:hypothetical protein
VVEKDVLVDGKGPYLTIDTPFNIAPGDTIRIVDRVWIAHTENVTFTLVETKTRSLPLIDWSSDIGDTITTTESTTWNVLNASPRTWHFITKTYRLATGVSSSHSYVTETLAIQGPDVHLDTTSFELIHLIHDQCLPIVSYDHVTLDISVHDNNDYQKKSR